MFISLRASEGYMLTDGVHYATTVLLAENRAAEDYKEITIEEYEKIMAEQEKESEIQ